MTDIAIMTTPLTPRPAATLIAVRDTAAGPEVLMLRRSPRAAFVADAYVFPGGALDPGDSSEAVQALCPGLDDVTASRLLGVAGGGLAYWVAAIRECFEEAGLLLAYDEHGALATLNPELTAQRSRLCQGELTLDALCRQYRLHLAVERLAYFSHWVTPPGLSRCFDTRFFVALAPPQQTARHDACETVEHVWIRPADALERQQRGEWELVFATVETLKTLAGFADSATLLAHAQTPRSIPRHAPHPARTVDGQRRLLLPTDYAYAEAVKLDPAGQGTTVCTLQAGVVTRLSAQVQRLTAPNPGPLTGPGTNTYLLGSADAYAVIDPGPADAAHIDALLSATQGRIRWILVTHTHHDHSPAAAVLKERTGAELLGLAAAVPDRQDQSFQPDRQPAHGEHLTLGACRLRVIHTPGHASNHLCYLLEDEKLLFTGDHVMQGSTVVINPPDGDMAAYIASLRALLAENIDWFAPGHGFLVADPHTVVHRLLAHRQAREDKVLAVLREQGTATLAQLLPAVYDDVPVQLHALASRSLLAHLLKLRGEDRIQQTGTAWQA